MIRAVLDINIFISAMLSQSGAPSSLVSALQRRQFVLIIPEAMISTLLLRLRAPRIAQRYGIREREIAMLVDLLRRRGTIAGPASESGLPSTGDPEDDIVLATAVSGRANYLVTGDKPLQSLGEYGGVKIVSPRAFLDILNAAHPE